MAGITAFESTNLALSASFLEASAHRGRAVCCGLALGLIWTGKHGVYTPVYTHRWSALAPFDPFGSDALNEHWTAGEMEHMVAQLGLGSQAAAYAADVSGEEATVRMTLVLGGYYPNAQKTIAK